MKKWLEQIQSGRKMRNFDYTKLSERMWDTEIVSYIAKIHECKGRQNLYVRQKTVELERLIEIARIQSTESSNKIEGIVTTSTRIKQLMTEKTTPKNRDESEIMGYRDVLNTIHESHDFIPIKPSYILQMHRDLLKRAGMSYGGHFKNVQNYINETKADGAQVTRFSPVPPYETEADEVGKYISIEKQIEKTKDVYYDVLEGADYGWHEEQNDPTPFIKYMLKVILACYTEFEERVGIMNAGGTKSRSYDMVRAYVEGKIGKFAGAEVIAACPRAGRSAILNSLKKLTEENVIVKCGSGRGTYYVRSDAFNE